MNGFKDRILQLCSCVVTQTVRDAAARLPNGQGTRMDICGLLRDSQYLKPNSAEAVLQSVVSGALDRLHYEPDPCVKYDTKRKIWIYLHRARSFDEFGELRRLSSVSLEIRRREASL